MFSQGSMLSTGSKTREDRLPANAVVRVAVDVIGFAKGSTARSLDSR